MAKTGPWLGFLWVEPGLMEVCTLDLLAETNNRDYPRGTAVSQKSSNFLRKLRIVPSLYGIGYLLTISFLRERKWGLTGPIGIQEGKKTSAKTVSLICCCNCNRIARGCISRHYNFSGAGHRPKRGQRRFPPI